MKKLFYSCFLTVAAIWALMNIGCINVEYIGQSLPPLPEEDPVMIFTPDFKPPVGKYRAIGRVLLTAPEGRSWSAILDALTEVAREHGADAIDITEIKHVNIGVSYSDNGRIAGPNWNSSNRTMTGELKFENSFGEAADVSRPQTFTEQRIQALIMVNIDRYNKELAAHKAKKAAAEADKKRVNTDASSEKSSETMKHNQTRNWDFSSQAIEKPARVEAKPMQVKLTDDRNNPVEL